MADEQSLREAKVSLACELATVAKRAGRLPDTAAIEAYLDPILAKVDQTEPAPPRVAPTARTPEVGAGEWYGEEGH